MDYPRARFGDFSFSRFGYIVRTDRQTESQSPMIAILTRLSSALVNMVRRAVSLRQLSLFIQ